MSRSAKLPRTVEEVQAHFPADIPKRIQDSIQDSIQHYLFVQDRDHRHHAWCSHCRQEVDLPASRHNKATACPNCGWTMTVKHLWRGISRMKERALTYHYQKSVLDPNIITAMAVYTEYDWGTWNGREDISTILPTQLIDSYYVFVHGVGAVQAAPYHGSRAINQYIFDGVPHFVVKKSVDARFGSYSGMYGYEGSTALAEPDGAEITAAAAGTPFRYAWQAIKDEAVEKAGYDACVRLFWYIARYPLAVEWMAKMGMGAMLSDMVQRAGYTGGAINWRGKDISSIIRGRLSKQDKAFLRDNGGYIDYHVLTAWQHQQKTNDPISIEEIVNMRITNAADIKAVEQYLSLRRAINYLKKQTVRDSVGGRMNLYVDYLEECSRLGADLKSKAVLFPKDLLAAHRKNSTKLKYIANQDNEIKYQRRYRQLVRMYEYADGTYCIIVPEQVCDLIREGEDMHNCVGGYCTRVATGRTDVVYIRELACPDLSLGTMEIRKGEIIQARGKYNEPLPAAVQEFVNKFREKKLEKNIRRKTA